MLCRLLGLLGVLACGCTGQIGDSAGRVGGGGGAGVSALAAVSGARRLTRVEYDNTLEDLLGDESRSGFGALPEDVYDPFDNDYLKQQASTPLIEGAEALAEQAALRLLADPAKRDAVVGCAPSGADDAACLRGFVERFGRLALRRPLAADEVDRYMALQAFAIERNDFWVGVELVLRALLQDPELLYRIEIGEPVAGFPGLSRLSDFEVATRLSYLLWGSTPDGALLALAEAGELSTPAQVRAAAATLLEADRAREQIERFHALWLGYNQLPHSAELTAAMRAESAALVDRVVFEGHEYFDLFRSDETFVGDLLAAHYGLSPPGSEDPTWVGYGDTGRRGILSHGSVLSAFSKFSDTSPTQRGRFVRTRLLCEVISPPPVNVNVDEPPTSPTSDCKVDRYSAHSTNGTCRTCHSQMDPIGFGLESFDKEGRYRDHDDGAPECAITGDGELVGVGAFNGPAELEELLISSGRLGPCIVRQVIQFALGRPLDPEDEDMASDLERKFEASEHSFEELLLDIVSAEAFGYRMEERE